MGTKRIRKRIGGTLRVENRGFQVTFPRGSCPEDIEASLKILYDFEPESGSNYALACPIIMLGPHGYEFASGRKAVEIELPVPHYQEIKTRHPEAKLVVYQSSTREGEPLRWRPLEVYLRVAEAFHGLFTQKKAFEVFKIIKI